MAVAELQTAVREKLPIIVVVFDDQEIGLIRVKQEIKGMPALRHSVWAAWTGRSSPRVLAPMVSRWTQRRASGDALGHALKSGRTTVIGVRIDASGYVAQFNALREL